jgi:hypothetical protein
MRCVLARIDPDDLDEASILLYRLWAPLRLKVDPIGLVINEPEYVTISDQWALYCSRLPADEMECELIAQDTKVPVVCACPSRPNRLLGLDVVTGAYVGPDVYLPLMGTLIHSAQNLPPPSVGRDPSSCRWATRLSGDFQLWRGRKTRLICRGKDAETVGFTWEPRTDSPYFFRSKSCKPEGKMVRSGHFKLAEQKGATGRAHLNLDLIAMDPESTSLLRLVPAGAGYKTFARQLPSCISPIAEIGI